MRKSGNQTGSSKELGSKEAKTDMTFSPAVEDNGAQPVRKPPSYLKHFVLN